MGVLSGNPQEQPLNYGEVIGVWSYLNAQQGKIAAYQTYKNHAGDQDLVKFLEDSIDQGRREAQQMEEILKNNGIALPPAPPERPMAKAEDIPAGARFNDPEIATALTQAISAGLNMCSLIIGQSTREDIAMMFSQIHQTKVQFGGRLLRINKEKGWLIPPPLHIQTPEPVTTQS
jgi:hypothetical protein